MTQGEVTVAWEQLQNFTKEIFVRAGMPPEGAEMEAGALIWANLRGVDSHGVLRIPWYLENIDKGVMNPKPDIKILNETPATLFVDADRALGPVVTIFTMERVIQKARQIGICWALIRNHTHQGALGHYTQMASRAGMAGIAFVCSPANMAPHGAKAAGVHNSPIAISVPARRHYPLSLDMATSVVAGGKLWLAVDKGVPIPEGWGLDKDGQATTDPTAVNALLPFGGPKGSGLAMMFECLTGVMSGNPKLEPSSLDREAEPAPEKKPGKGWSRLAYMPPHNQNSVVAAIDIATFTDLEEYKDHIDSLIDGLKALPRADGFDEIFVPGEPEEKTCAIRSRDGIPLPPGTLRNLHAVAEQFGVALPAGL